MFRWLFLKYTLSGLVAALNEPEMMLMGTSEYTMYLFETLPARKMAEYSAYSDKSATHNATPITFREPRKYRGANVMSADRMSHTGKATRITAYGSICGESNCLTSVESVCTAFRIIELSMATAYFAMKYVAVALRIVSRIATGFTVRRWASRVKTTMKRLRPASRYADRLK